MLICLLLFASLFLLPSACAQEEWLYYDPRYPERDLALADVPALLSVLEGGRMTVDQQHGFIRLDGRYSLVAPDAAHMIRLRLHYLERFRLDLPGEPGLHIEMTGHQREFIARQVGGPWVGGDGHMWIRLSAGILDLRIQDGRFVLAQGDVILLSAPFEGKPEQIALDIDAQLHGAIRLPCTPLPYPSLEHLLLPPEPPPDSWTLSNDKEAKLEQTADGVTLSRKAGKATIHALANIAAERGGVLTIPIWADVGTSLYIKRPDDPHAMRVAVGEFQGERVLRENPANEGHVQKLHAVGRIAAEQFWLRFLLGHNLTVVQVSTDAAHWFELEQHRIGRDHLSAEHFQLGLLIAEGTSGRIRIGTPRLAPWKGAIEALSDEGIAGTKVGERGDRLFHAVMDAVRRGEPFDRVLPAMQELPWRLVPWQVSDDGVWWALWELYERMGERLAAMGQGKRLGELLAAWPSQHPGMLRFVRKVRSEPPVITERRFYDLWYRQQWETLLQEARRLIFVQVAGSSSASSHYRKGWDRQLAWWMATEAKRRLANNSTRHPLLIGADREFANTFGELTIALETNEVERAARLLTEAELPDILVPSRLDPELFVRSSARIRDLIDASPALQKELKQSFTSVGRLRLAQARQFGKVDVLRRLRTHFHGTSVAAEAALELANRELSLGHFAAAAQAYRQLPEPPADKLALIDSLHLASEPAPLLSAPDSGAFELETIDGLQLRRQTLEYHHHEFSGAAGFVKSATRLVVHHHCLLFALDKAGKIAWQRARQQLPRPLPHPATPVFVGGTVIVPEHAPEKGWSLIACAVADGALRWQSGLFGSVIAGPVAIGDSLYLATASDERGGQQIKLQRVDWRDGLLHEPIVVASVHADDRLHVDSGLTSWGDQLILRAANALFAIDAEGPRWARRLLCVPVDHLRAPDTHRNQPPLVIGDNIVCHALGSGGVHCLDASTGRLLWQHVEPTARNLLQLSDAHLAVFTERGFTVLRADTGAPVSYRHEHIATQGVLPAANGDIAMVWCNKINNDWDATQRRVRWFDPHTGEQRAEAILGGPRELADLRGLWSDGRDIYGFAVHRAWEKNDPIRFVRLRAQSRSN